MSEEPEPLTASERDMLVRCLTELYDHQSNAGCNDIKVENTPGNVSMIRAVLADEDYDYEPWDPPTQQGLFYAPCGDAGFTSYLLRRIQESS